MNRPETPITAQESEYLELLEDLYDPEIDYTEEYIREKELDFNEA